MAELTQKEARAELNKLTLEEIITLAEEQGYATADVSKEDLIERLLGNCAGCKKKDLG